MAPERTEPTDAEWRILRIVIDRGSVATRDVVDEAASRFDWSTSTIKTLLRRLVAKGHLKTKAVGNTFVYRASASGKRSLRRAADALLERAADGTVAPLIAYMVRRSRLSADELAELRALLDDEEGAR